MRNKKKHKMSETKDDASIGSMPASDDSEESHTGSVCSRSSRRSSSEFRVAPDDALQELVFLHREMEQLTLQYEGRFWTPVRDLESWPADNAASSVEGTLVDTSRVVSFSEPQENSETPPAETSTPPTQDVKPESRSSWLSVKLGRVRVSRRKGDETAKRKTKKKKKKEKEAREASPSSSSQRLRSALGPSLGSFGFLAFLAVGIFLVFAYATAFRGGRVVRRPEALAAKKPINEALTYG